MSCTISIDELNSSLKVKENRAVTRVQNSLLLLVPSDLQITLDIVRLNTSERKRRAKAEI